MEMSWLDMRYKEWGRQKKKKDTRTEVTSDQERIRVQTDDDENRDRKLDADRAKIEERIGTIDGTWRQEWSSGTHLSRLLLLLLLLWWGRWCLL
jgi:hypothetical protein